MRGLIPGEPNADWNLTSIRSLVCQSNSSTALWLWTCSGYRQDIKKLVEKWFHSKRHDNIMPWIGKSVLYSWFCYQVRDSLLYYKVWGKGPGWGETTTLQLHFFPSFMAVNWGVTRYLPTTPAPGQGLSWYPDHQSQRTLSWPCYPPLLRTPFHKLSLTTDIIQNS